MLTVELQIAAVCVTFEINVGANTTSRARRDLRDKRHGSARYRQEAKEKHNENSRLLELTKSY